MPLTVSATGNSTATHSSPDPPGKDRVSSGLGRSAAAVKGAMAGITPS
jgi:hypothetical protein